MAPCSGVNWEGLGKAQEERKSLQTPRDRPVLPAPYTGSLRERRQPVGLAGPSKYRLLL